MEEANKRKTYSLAGDKSNELARHSLTMGEELGKTVPRQKILDVLVGFLSDEKIFNKVKTVISKE